ncbi:DNA-3-methyladenine glycosylase I [Alicyclobacillus vulcanalis]|uniref:DNA-3-methyladenine glycosylase I n=1 Tax=Alicyclobacillus vulcanalis TaxID=252246 RepID=A0A1N7M4I0_9BACL|nr:DNA-3-methyladenine glycosylase I [Alicyclobacillus vulcanalis]SIS80977.1 DNA-3-methyladenine glycosylase I [Alicyclobacillus vulcanalis]
MYRCQWAGTRPLYVRYHDEEWGVPQLEDRALFEFLTLEAAQAGLQWYLILARREAYRQAFADFQPEVVARYGQEDVERLLAPSSQIIRNKAKVEAAVHNARVFLEVQAKHGSFARWLWGFVDGKPEVHAFQREEDVPATSPLAERVSREMRSLGFRFVGPVMVYAYLQAVGVVMDHVVPCFRYDALRALAESMG